MTTKKTINLKEHLQNKFVAFLDVMGFSNLVNKGSLENLESYFEKITDVLDKLKNDKQEVQAFLISDSIILIASEGLNGFKQLLYAIRRIQSAILWRKILLRGAVSFGQVYYNAERNILVGKGFIKAYLLEQEAIFPRVIIDPAIIKLMSPDKTAFLKLINKTLDYSFEERLIYTQSKFAEIPDDGIFIDYANKLILKESINGNLNKVYEAIVDNLYSEQKLYSKYIWLKGYFLENLRITNSFIVSDSSPSKKHKKALESWIAKFERL